MMLSKDLELFQKGIHYELYHVLGAHPKIVNGIKGTYFAVWAPNAKSVSVVGDFNLWNGENHQMHAVNGIFELFVPFVTVGDLYKYEVHTCDGRTCLKADPFGFSAELRPNNASKVADICKFEWHDGQWMCSRKRKQSVDSAISIYEVYLGSFARKEDGSYLNYTELADRLIPYVKEMGYTHVELMPVMEHPFDGSWGYQVIGYYAPTSRYGSPKDFAEFVNKLHKADIGVLLDWVPAHFPRDEHGLSNFDGTCLYEHFDVRKGAHPHWGTLIFDYAKPEVCNYLIANALYWIEKYHIDGIRVDAVASMLYLDYGREPGAWEPNIYGGRENLEAIEFFKHLNSIIHKRNPGVITVAEESTAWPLVTGTVEEGGLGFDFKWNMGYMHDFIEYIRKDPYFRSYSHNQLTFSMVYAYSEKFMLAFSHDEAVHGKGTMLGKMFGNEQSKFAALRATYTYMVTHPGKKLLFMGQDIGEYQEFSEQRTVNFDLLQYPLHNGVKTLVQDLNALYRTKKALTKLDQSPSGFQWINCDDAQTSIVSFMRKTKKKEDTLIVVANFSGIPKTISLGVPHKGKYKEILNTDNTRYAGGGLVNRRVKFTKDKPMDGQGYSITIDIAAQSVAIFEYMPVVE